MDPISPASIHETLQAGRVVEARTLLTIHGNVFSAEERRILDQELTRRTVEAEQLVARAEAMEKEGRTEEAKELYESVVLFAADFPGIHSHINRMEESLLLTRAIKKRSQRIRESAPVKPNAPRTKKSVPLLAAGLAMGAVATLLFFSGNQPRETTSPKAPQAEQVQIAAIQPAASPEQTPSPLPIETKVEQPIPPEPPVDLLEDTGQQTPPPSPQQPEESSPRITEPPPNDATVQSTDEWYTVRRGDSLSLIAIQQFCNSEAWKKIYQLNRERVPDPNKLQPGMQLQVKGIENRCTPAP